MGRAITAAGDMDALPIGSIIAMSKFGVTMNTALKTEADNWALAGQVRKYTTEKLHTIATDRDDYEMTIIYEAAP